MDFRTIDHGMVSADDFLEGNVHASEASRLRSKCGELALQIDRARRDKDRETGLRLVEELRPLRQRLKELGYLGRFRQAVPITWTHDADESRIEAAIASDALKKLAADETAVERNALALGPSKIGKSTTFALMVRRHCLRGGHARWFYVRDLCQSERRHRLGEGEPPEVRSASEASLLVLDDLGLEEHHGAVVDVIHRRYEANLVTWTSAGLSLEELTGRYGEAFVRRLVECGGQRGRAISCFGKGPR